MTAQATTTDRTPFSGAIIFPTPDAMFAALFAFDQGGAHVTTWRQRRWLVTKVAEFAARDRAVVDLANALISAERTLKAVRS